MRSAVCVQLKIYKKCCLNLENYFFSIHIVDLFINYCYLLFIKLVFFVLTTVCVYIKRTGLDIFNKLVIILFMFSIFTKNVF